VFLRTPPVSIDIGSHSVKVAQVTEGRGGVRVIRFAEQQLPAGVRWEIGADRRPLVETIRQALAKAGIRRRSAIMALPRRQVTARISAYPEAERNALRRVIEYDLADQIPFPVEQVILDFQTLGPSREQAGLTDVLVVAAQRDLVREYLAVAKDLGMGVAVLTVDVLALHDLTRSLPQGPPGITLTVEVGARASSINVSEGGRLRLTRSVGMGGQQLSLAIRDDLNVSMEEAERLKGTEGLALLDREPQPHRIRAWFDNFRGELRRSALSFGQAVVSRVVLLGAGSEVPGLSDAIQSEFGVQPISLSAPQLFPHALLRGAEQHIADHCLLAVGQALRGTSRTAWTISLVPREVAEGRRGRALRVAGSAAAVLVIAGVAFGYISQAQAVSREQAQIKVLGKRAKLAEQEHAQAKQVFDQRTALTKDLQIVQSAQARRYAVLELLRTISDLSPKGVILTHFILRLGQPLQIQGTAPSSDAVADLQAGIGRSHLVTTVNLDRADQVTVTRAAPGARGAPAPAAQQPDQPQPGKNRQVTRYGRQLKTVPGKSPAAPSRAAAPAPPPMVQQVAQEVSFTLTVHLWNEEQSSRSSAVASRARP